jgi:hypothetical protein
MEPSLSRGCAVLLTFEQLMNWLSPVSEAIGAFHFHHFASIKLPRREKTSRAANWSKLYRRPQTGL